MKKEIKIPQPSIQRIRIKSTLDSNYAGMVFKLLKETEDRYFATKNLSFLKTDCEVIIL